MGEIEHQRHGATPVGQPEGSGADPFLHDGLDLALDPVAMLARDDPVLLDGFAEQPEQRRVGFELGAIGLLDRRQRPLQLVVSGIGALT